MKDFNQMTSGEIRNYKGPIYRASVRAVRIGESFLTDRDMRHDLESVSLECLSGKVHGLAREWKFVSVVYGPHTEAP